MRTERPQTIAFRARPGELLKHPIARAATSPTTISDEDYLKLIRQCPCLKCGLDPCNEAAHLRSNSGLHNKRQAMSKKPTAKWTLPLCSACHTRDPDSQHKIGELAFWNQVGLNPFLVCEKLYAKAGDALAMRATIFNAIAERESASQCSGGSGTKLG